MGSPKLQHLLLKSIIKSEKNTLWLITFYAAIIGVLSLIVPVTVQSLVNSVGLGNVLQPIAVLTIFVFGLLGMAGVIKLLQYIATEKLFRRLFVNMSVYAADHFLKVGPTFSKQNTAGEASHRFFEIIYLQKVSSQLILEGVVIVLQTIVGLVLLAFYHPILLGFNVLLLIAIFIICGPMRSGALQSAYAESSEKYNVASALYGLARSGTSLTGLRRRRFVFERLDGILGDYLDHRSDHFSLLARQWGAAISLQVVFSAALLGLGAVLVIRNQLSLGQLVASELVLTGVLAGVAKLGKLLESYYDLAISFEKLSQIQGSDVSEIEPWELTAEKRDLSKYQNYLADVETLHIPIADGHEIKVPRGKATSISPDYLQYIVPTMGGIESLQSWFTNKEGQRVYSREARDFYFTDFVYAPGEAYIGGVSLRDELLLGDSPADDITVLEAFHVLDLEDSYRMESLSLDSRVEEISPDFYAKLANMLPFLRALLCAQSFVVAPLDLQGLSKAQKLNFIAKITSQKFGKKALLIPDSDIATKDSLS